MRGLENKSHGKGTKSEKNKVIHTQTDIATTRPKRPKGRFGEIIFLHKILKHQFHINCNILDFAAK